MKKRKFTQFKPQVRSRHPSHKPLRIGLSLLPFRSVIRLGSTTDLPDTVSNGGKRIECNTIDAVNTSSSKVLMKKAFDSVDIKTPEWWLSKDVGDIVAKDFPIIAKKIHGSRGRGMVKINNEEELGTFLQGNVNGYYFEKFYNYNREYRLHVTEDGCFYCCRKMLKEETPEEERWYRNDSNCTWYLESNPGFNKPSNWDEIEAECVKAIKAVGLDIGACDVRVQSDAKESPKWCVLETNSGASFGNVTLAKYTEEIPKVLKKKAIA